MKDNTLRGILDTGTIIVNVTSSGTGLSMTGQTNFTTHLGDDWGVVYRGKTVSLQEFIETLLAEEIQKAVEGIVPPTKVVTQSAATLNHTLEAFGYNQCRQDILDRIKQLEDKK